MSVTSSEHELSDILRDYELRLLRCTHPCASPPPPPRPTSQSLSNLHQHIHELLSSIESGNYSKALSSDAARLFFSPLASAAADTNHEVSANHAYSQLLPRLSSFILDEAADRTETSFRAFIVMCLAVAALFGFVQCNITGPVKELPLCPFSLPTTSSTNKDEKEYMVEWDGWARKEIMSAGSDLLAKFTHLQYIPFAKTLVMGTKDLLFHEQTSVREMQTISWWLARILFLQQRILDERSSSLLDLLQVCFGETLQNFGSLEQVSAYWGDKLCDGEAPTIVSMIHIEAGTMNYYYGRIDSCRQHFESAELAAGLQLSVMGVLGFRTVHQVDAKAQLVLVTGQSSSTTSDTSTCDSSIGEKKLHRSQRSTDEASEILMTPRLLEDDESKVDGTADVGSTTTLLPIQQMVVLAKCLLIEKSSRHDEMQRWDMAPYIEAIDSQQSLHFSIQQFCDILRIRWESTRSRTKERALMMMDNLVEGIYEISPSVPQRMLCSYGVHIPTIPALRKEYGELLIRCGLIGDAVKIFEELELWDSLIFCYRLLEKRAAAVELIKKRLSVMPNDPRLWCSLGDVTNDDACYKKALEVSDNRSARAKRSLARSAYNRGEYESSLKLWESAMALNSLYPDGWFALGAAALKARNIEKALDGFTRAVQVDPENGEAWNNVACLHMVKKRSKEAFIAFKEALKFKRNSWQLWENYAQVAVDVGNISQALEAIQMVSNMSGGKRVDTDLLEKIMSELERRAQDSSKGSISAVPDPDSFSEPTSSESASVRLQEGDRLLNILGETLKEIVKKGSTTDVWGLYARWHRMKGDFKMCAEALLKQVRSYKSSDIWKDEERFKRYARAFLELCNVYMEIAKSTGSCGEILSAQMELNSLLKQAKEKFADTEEYKDLQSCSEDVQKIRNSSTKS